MSTPPLEQRLPVSPTFWEELRAAYRDPPRHYHSFDHVLAVLEQYDAVHADIGWREPDEVLLAVLFHDAVYLAGRADNEYESAQLAVAAIERWLPDRGIASPRVVELIELTAQHGRIAPGSVDRESALFLDCDMAILGASEPVYRAYSAAVTREVEAIAPRHVYCTGRRAFLSQLLAAPRIFLSDYFHDLLDRATRRNLRGELDELG
jgi:predicted metal-dependent HD superfamily phosphohydrolase